MVFTTVIHFSQISVKASLVLFKRRLTLLFRLKNMASDSLEKSIKCNELKISGMRTKYENKENTFLESHLASKNPILMFKTWFEEATKAPGIAEANAMCVSTASKEGRPSARYLLLKGFGPEGFKFFTNYNSRKGKELEENPWVALTFYWEPLHRSVRVEGQVKKLSAKESDEYFHSRPRESQIGAWVSEQSTVIASRELLNQREAQLEQQYQGKHIPRPPHWGGFLVEPESIEFWQGQSNRVHDRIRFRRRQPTETLNNELTHIGEDGWVYERLSP